METFDQVWESSRHNAWSGYYALLVWSGLGAIIVLSFVRRPWLRRAAKLIAVFVFAYYAALYSSFEISEKWRIRREWAEAHQDVMTDTERYALTVDGANLALGPILEGATAACLLFVAAMVTEIADIVWLRERKRLERPM